MILVQRCSVGSARSDLHVCGDDPNDLMPASASLVVISTYVEMILIRETLILVKKCILHVSGDDPKQETSQTISDKYSPRKWR